MYYLSLSLPQCMNYLFSFFFLFLLYFVIFILKIREVSRPHNFSSQPLIHLRHLLKEAYMYSSLYKFLSLTFITQSPSNHRASFVFCTITACMMSGTGIHWCQSKIKFCFKTLQILQHEVSDCAIEYSVAKPGLLGCFSKNMFILFKARICPTSHGFCQPGNI